jgi:hypothetical protein
VGASELNLGALRGYASTTASFFDPMTGAALSTPIIYGEYYSPPAFPQFVDGDASTLSGLFKWRGEQIDPIADATMAPGHFLPGCGFRAELVLRGGGCDVALGWYNFTGDGPPALADIQPLVPQGSTYLNGAWPELVPLAWDNRHPLDLSTFAWTPRVFSSGDIAANPEYAGGDIAFAMLGSGSCSTEKFSVYEHNPKNAAGMPWVTALIYRSVVDSSAIYLAFEDLPMSPEDWRVSGGVYANDADFNDAVFYISGLGAPASCPDPRCQDVVCGVDEICAQGECMPSGGSGDGGGGGGGSEGAASSSSGGEDGSSGAAGAATTSQAGAGSETTSEGGGAAPEVMGGAAPASGGASEGGRGGVASAADPGCSCHVSSVVRARAHPLLLGLVLALVLARRRAHRPRA